MKNVKNLFVALLVLCTSLSTLFAQEVKFNPGDAVFICAYNGLNLREDATTKSNVILKLDHAEMVTILEVSEETLEIEHRKSKWLKVDANGDVGFLFGGYLTKFEPMYLDAASFECQTDLYYLDWVMDVIGDTPIDQLNKSTAYNKAYTPAAVETTNYTSYQNGSAFYNRVGPNTDSYFFESVSLDYNDVLNFMEYMVACQNRFCHSNSQALFRPIKNHYGDLVRVDCTMPLGITAQQRGAKMIVKMETCL